MAEQGSGRPLATRSSFWLATGALLLFLLFLYLWLRPSDFPQAFPTQIEYLDRQIWAAGIADQFPEQYAAFHQQVLDLRNRWREESRRWWPSWTVEEFTESYHQLMTSGATLQTAAGKHKTAFRDQIQNILKHEQDQITRLRDLNGLFDLRGRQTALSHAESLLAQVASFLSQDQLDHIPNLIRQAQDAMEPIEILAIQQMSRYADSQHIGQWNRWVTETINLSLQTGKPVIVIIKASQEFRLYQKGHLRQHFSTDLGFSGLQDKRYEGDGATPEGIFHIVQKKTSGETKFYKAFMLDFPTPLHQRRFQTAKARGLIPVNRGIGGLIEIHGQPSGRNNPTNGCVALENSIMDKLFPLIPLKTPVVIVGALDPVNSVSTALALIYEHYTNRKLSPLSSFPSFSSPSR
ncbi:MAG: murein L,D-transpeptidase family protein [Nitrospirales bacterium]|nr:L,D-transpeptidase [Nitrospirales bacterium]